MPPPSPRIAWAVEELGLRPGHHVLEIGCGHGVAVTLAAAAVAPGGTVTAIDRSATMVEAAVARNREAVEAGTVTVLGVRLEEADLPAGRFDRVLAVHVDLVRGDGSPGLGAVREALAPGGALHLVMHPPVAAGVEAFAARAAAVLPRHGLRVERVARRELGGTPAVCVVAGAAPG
ncbi:MAG: cyclopropane-fatty-acyl-phospholipid synthase family protein [Thermoleophilia bacterium]